MASIRRAIKRSTLRLSSRVLLSSMDETWSTELHNAWYYTVSDRSITPLVWRVTLIRLLNWLKAEQMSLSKINTLGLPYSKLLYSFYF